MAKRSTAKGIFCLEGDWWGVKDTTSVEPMMRLLETYAHSVPYIHRDVGTIEEFDHYLKKWLQKGLRKYPILYLGFHGGDGGLYVGERRRGVLTLDELGERLTGKCEGRLIHFGSCSTLRVHGSTINRFLKTTGAAAVVGYQHDVDWIECAGFELLVLGQLQYYDFTVQGMQEFKAYLKETAPGLMKKLGFRFVPHPEKR